MRAQQRNNNSNRAIILPEAVGEKSLVPDAANSQHIQYLKSLIISIWQNDISTDYSKHFLLKEDTLKNAIYYHLRRKLGENYLHQHRLRIFTEFTIAGQRMDLVVAQVDVDKAEGEHLQLSVDRIVVAMELKYKSSTADTEFKKDVRKVVDFLQNPTLSKCHFFVGFIQEVSFDKPVDFTWLDDEQRVQSKGRVTELIQFIDGTTGMPVWDFVDH